MAQDNIEYKRLSAKLPTAAIIFVGILILGFIFVDKPKYEFKLSSSEMLEEALKYEHVLGPQKLVSIYLSNDSLYQFIDLRDPRAYAEGHLEGAINIPANSVLRDQYQDILNQSDKIIVLYHESHIETCGPWLVLKQLGYKNMRVMKGGYNYAQGHLVDEFSPLSGQHSDEQALYDFVKVINSTGGSATVGSSSKVKAPTTVKKKKKVAEEEGGC